MWTREGCGGEVRGAGQAEEQGTGRGGAGQAEEQGAGRGGRADGDSGLGPTSPSLDGGCRPIMRRRG